MWVTLLSDYGHEDEYVGVLHGVLARLAPEARVIDLLHDVPRHDVRAGALALRRAIAHTPSGVHLAVVDPEVGGTRRAVAVRCADDDRLLVGPDNGLLVPAADRCGGVVEAVEISSSPHRLEPVSATFHGRDLFAPVAAALARGEALADAGDPLSTDELVGLELPASRVEGDTLVVHALAADRFGNVVLAAEHATVTALALRLGHEVTVSAPGFNARARHARTFADVAPGELLLYEDAAGQLALAVNRGDAWSHLGLERDAEVRLEAATG